VVVVAPQGLAEAGQRLVEGAEFLQDVAQVTVAGGEVRLERLVGKSRRSSDSSGSDASRANVLAELQSEDTFPDSL
jgi:hypothetical protein